MKIASFQPCSINEYPNHISSIVFVQGCNFECSYCCNPELIPHEFHVSCGRHGLISEEAVFRNLDKIGKKIGAVTITGGEPLIQDTLIDFLCKLRQGNYLVKINTNGSIYKELKNIIKNKLVDYINMDIKGPISMYEEIINKQGECLDKENYWCGEDILESVSLIKSCGIDHIFSVVKHPMLNENSINEIKDWVGESNLVLRESII
jgi:pyruvate formate lyase activating enzyme